MNFRTFQREDLARIACTDGAILGWEQGLGKTIALFTIPLLKVGFTGHLEPKSPVMLVAPANLVPQLQAEGLKLFGITTTPILSQEAFIAMTRPLRPGFYITSFTALAINGDSPKLFELLRDQFTAVILDEGTRIQKDDSLTTEAVCSLRPKYRFLLTGTPIKNRLRSIFRLAWWVAGGTEEPSSRFPFRADDAKGFAETFTVTQKAAGRSVKATAETCNLHMAWKLLAPLVLRRRKDETNETLVAKVYRSVRVPLGTAQAAAYAAVIAAPPLDARGAPAFMASLSRLRKAASVIPDCGHVLTPKLQAVLSILRNLLTEGEQVIVFSCFHDVLDAVGVRLRACGVPAHRADGRIGPEGCARLAAQFRAKEFPVLLCGDAMTDGHSFPDVAHVVRIDRPWAHDKAAQAPDRAHRLNSSRDVTIWDVSTDHTIDVVIDSLLADKSQTADLVLDGRLQARMTEEMTPAKLFRAAECVWETGDTVDESSLADEWDEIAASLRKTVRSGSMVADWRRRLSC